MATTDMFYHLDGHEFEDEVCWILEAAELGQAHKQPKTRDGGIDIILITPNEKKIAIECKNTLDKVGRPVVNKLLGASAVDVFDEVWVIASNEFSQLAEEFAYEINQKRTYPTIKLIDGSTIEKLYIEAKHKSNNYSTEYINTSTEININDYKNENLDIIINDNLYNTPYTTNKVHIATRNTNYKHSFPELDDLTVGSAILGCIFLICVVCIYKVFLA